MSSLKGCIGSDRMDSSCKMTKAGDAKSQTQRIALVIFFQDTIFVNIDYVEDEQEKIGLHRMRWDGQALAVKGWW